MFTPTTGTANEAFVQGVRSPMIPQDVYRPGAAGPAYLAGLGSPFSNRHYYAPLRQIRQPVHGVGDASSISDLLGSGMDKVIETVVVRSMPIVMQQVKPVIEPIQVMAVVTLALSAGAAVFGYLNWSK